MSLMISSPYLTAVRVSPCSTWRFVCPSSGMPPCLFESCLQPWHGTGRHQIFGWLNHLDHLGNLAFFQMPPNTGHITDVLRKYQWEWQCLAMASLATSDLCNLIFSPFLEQPPDATPAWSVSISFEPDWCGKCFQKIPEASDTKTNCCQLCNVFWH